MDYTFATPTSSRVRVVKAESYGNAPAPYSIRKTRSGIVRIEYCYAVRYRYDHNNPYAHQVAEAKGFLLSIARAAGALKCEINPRAHTIRVFFPPMSLFNAKRKAHCIKKQWDIAPICMRLVSVNAMKDIVRSAGYAR